MVEILYSSLLPPETEIHRELSFTVDGDVVLTFLLPSIRLSIFFFLQHTDDLNSQNFHHILVLLCIYVMPYCLHSFLKMDLWRFFFEKGSNMRQIGG